MIFTTELEGNPGYWWVSVFDDKGQKAYITEPFGEQWEAVDMAQGWIAKQENAALRTRVAELEGALGEAEDWIAGIRTGKFTQENDPDGHGLFTHLCIVHKGESPDDSH